MASGRMRVGLAALVACLFAAGTVGYLARERARDSVRWLEHTTNVKLALAAARMHADDAYIASVRGGDPASALDAAARDAAAVGRLVADNAGQQERARTLAERVAHVRSTAAAAAVFDVDAIQASVFDMTREEDALLAVRTAARERARKAWSTVLEASVAGVFVLAAIGIALILAQRRSLARKAALLESVVESIGEAVMVLSPDRKLLVKNAAARAMFVGASPGRSSGTNVTYRDGGAPFSWDNGPLARALNGESTDAVVIKVSRASAPDAWVSATARPVQGEDGQLVGAVAVYRDISQQIRDSEALASLSTTDELTALSNRRGFMLLGEQHARLAQRSRSPFVVVFADLNGLKTINDTLGHDAGDRAIGDAGRVLKGAVRECDIVGRLGGDEFVILLANSTLESAQIVQERIRRALRAENERPVAYRLSISMGATAFDPANPRSLTELLTDADRWMYVAKRERPYGSLTGMRAAAHPPAS